MEKVLRRRAIGEIQKEERKQAILDTAWNLFQATNYEALTMSEVAEAAGLAKGTLFLYFKTKESLFLAIVGQQLNLWFAEVNADLKALNQPNDIPLTSSVLSQALEQRPSLVRLLAILHTILERNISPEETRLFKRYLLQHFAETGQLLENCLPFLEPGKGVHLLLQSYALVIGMWHLTDPAPIAAAILEESEFRPFKLNFATEFSAAIQALWRGLQND